MWKFGVVTAVLLVAGQPANAQPIDCSRIENDAERLACFDQLHPQPQVEPPRAKPAPTPASQPAQNRERVEIPDVMPAVRTEPKGKSDDPAPPPAVLNDTLVDTGALAVIDGVLSHPKDRMVFRLDNRQIWIQTSPRELPIRVGDKVTIKSGTVGGYFLTTEAGVTTRVRRIE